MSKPDNLEIKWLDESTLKVSGVIDEFSSFGDVFKDREGKLYIDFSEVERINSSGVREWIQAALGSKAELHLINTAPVIIDQVSMIPQFLGNNGSVDSFYAHYVCPSCGHESSSLIEVNDQTTVQALKDKTQECEKCANEMDMDHTPDVFLAFLESRSKAS